MERACAPAWPRPPKCPCRSSKTNDVHHCSSIFYGDSLAACESCGVPLLANIGLAAPAFSGCLLPGRFSGMSIRITSCHFFQENLFSSSPARPVASAPSDARVHVSLLKQSMLPPPAEPKRRLLHTHERKQRVDNKNREDTHALPSALARRRLQQRPL